MLLNRLQSYLVGVRFTSKKKYKGKFTQRELELLSFILHRVYEETTDQLIKGFCKRVLERFEFLTDWSE